LTFQGLLTTMALKEAKEELEEIAEAQKDLWSLPHELFTCLGEEEWRKIIKDALSYWCSLALDKERGREWKKEELEENLLNFLCNWAPSGGKEEEFAEKIRKHQKLRRAYIGFLSEMIRKLRTYQRLLKMLEGEEKG